MGLYVFDVVMSQFTDTHINHKISTYTLSGVACCLLQVVHLSFGGHISSNKERQFLSGALKVKSPLKELVNRE